MFKHFVSALALAFATLSTAQAETHLARPNTSSHVTLIAYGSLQNNGYCHDPGNRSFYRVSENGFIATDTPFAVPNGQTLVVTDVEWTARGGLHGAAPFAANKPLRFELRVGGPGAGPGLIGNRPVYSSSRVIVTPALVNEFLGETDHMTTGFVVGAGAYICPKAYQYSEAPNYNNTAFLETVVLHGYLVP